MKNLRYNLKKIAFIIIVILVICTIVYFGFNILFYGSIKGFLNKCEYTEQIIPTPPELASSTLTLERDVYLANGEREKNKDYGYPDCGPIMSKIKSEIVTQVVVDNANADYHPIKGLDIQKIYSPQKFSLVEMVLVKRGGLSAIDSSGKHLFLILKDESGNLYKFSSSLLMDNINIPTPPYFQYSGKQGSGDLTFDYFYDLIKSK